MRQYLFDEAEQVRLAACRQSTASALRQAGEKILPEEGYHVLHTAGLVERRGDATEESHTRMQAACEKAFPQALGMFEHLEHEQQLVAEGVFPGNDVLKQGWLERVGAGLARGSLRVPASAAAHPDLGGRRGAHTHDLQQAVNDLQSVFRSEPGAAW